MIITFLGLSSYFLTSVTTYRGFHFVRSKVKTEDKKYGLDGLQVVLDNLQTAIAKRD